MREGSNLTATLILDEDENISRCEEDMQKSKIGLSTEYTIVKRNGMLVPFRRERIFNALEAAFRDTKKIEHPHPLSETIRQTIGLIADLVVEEAVNSASHGTLLTVEGIQDIVEVKLMETGHHDVARDYIIYRDEHKKLRKDSPRALKILRRDGISFVRFNPMKIASSIERAFRETLKITGPTPEEVIEAVNLLTHKIVDFAVSTLEKGEVVSIEMIQNAIEKQLMIEGYYDIAKDMILYRAERMLLKERSREEGDTLAVELEVPIEEEERESVFTVVRKDGSHYKLSRRELKKRITHACKGYKTVASADELVDQALANFYDGIKEHEVDLATIMAARAKVEVEPAYTYVAANLLLDVLYRETIGVEASIQILPKSTNSTLKNTSAKVSL